MDKVFVVKRVAEKLWATEDTVDAAITDMSELMVQVVGARKELQIPHLIVDPAVKKVAEAMGRMAEARQALIEAHHALNEARLRIGVRDKVINTTMNGYPSFVHHEDTTVMGEERKAV
jgi:hypothetical protein